MTITTSVFAILDYNKDCYQININGNFTGSDTYILREEVSKCINLDYDLIYINAKEIEETDLSGINEIIHSNYVLNDANKKLIFLYKRNSAIEKWVDTTGLDKFIDTAIIPAD